MQPIWISNMMNCYNKNILFVPGCLLCPLYQADASEKNLSWARGLREMLALQEINLIQLPCPEASFGGYDAGLKRKPRGLKYYSELPGFQEHCSDLAGRVVKQICELRLGGKRVIAIVGIEHSPTCAVNYIYTNKGTIRHKGIFFQEIDMLLLRAGVEVPFVGINRRFYRKSTAELAKLINAAGNQKWGN